MEGLKNSKYTLLKNEDNLNNEQLNKPIQLKKVSSILKVMHELKEKIRKIFNKTNDWYPGVFKLVLLLQLMFLEDVLLIGEFFDLSKVLELD
ncbi:transposase [Nostoc sp. NZL]|nr:transposase [Nostoc sp. NZL]